MKTATFMSVLTIATVAASSVLAAPAVKAMDTSKVRFWLVQKT